MTKRYLTGGKIKKGADRICAFEIGIWERCDYFTNNWYWRVQQLLIIVIKDIEKTKRGKQRNSKWPSKICPYKSLPGQP